MVSHDGSQLLDSGDFFEHTWLTLALTADERELAVGDTSFSLPRFRRNRFPIDRPNLDGYSIVATHLTEFL
jgi:hypothetical protein